MSVFRRFSAAPLTLLFCLLAQPAGAAGTCDVTWRLTNNPGSIFTLVWTPSYANAGGSFRDADSVADCVELLAGSAILGAVDNEGGKTLTLSLNAQPGGFSGPTDLARCVFEPSGAAPSAGDFPLLFPATGLHTNFTPVTGASVVVASVSCEGIVTTTTSTSTSSSTSSTSTSSSTSTTTLPPPGCGDRGGDGVKATDALFALIAALGGEICDDCICDADGNGKQVATDALRILQFAVGADVELLCPPCVL